MLDKTYENCIHLIKRPISCDLDNRVSGRPRIEKKKQKKKVHCWSQVGDISLNFCDEKRLWKERGHLRELVWGRSLTCTSRVIFYWHCHLNWLQEWLKTLKQSIRLTQLFHCYLKISSRGLSFRYVWCYPRQTVGVVVGKELQEKNDERRKHKGHVID